MIQELKEAFGKANIMDLQGIKYIRLDQVLDIVGKVLSVPISNTVVPAADEKLTIITAVPPNMVTSKKQDYAIAINQFRTNHGYPRIEDAHLHWLTQKVAELELRLASIESRHGNVGYAGPVRVYEKADNEIKKP